MQRTIKLSPVAVLKVVLIVSALLAVGMRFGLVPSPWQTANAQVSECDTVDGQCPAEEPVDVCWNIDDVQTSVPAGYYIDQTQDNACVAEEVKQPQVLGDSTTKTPTPVAEPVPQILGEQTGK